MIPTAEEMADWIDDEKCEGKLSWFGGANLDDLTAKLTKWRKQIEEAALSDRMLEGGDDCT